MATYGPKNLPAYLSTDQDFRTWVAGVRAALLAVGLVQTSDSGQIDTATVARPTTMNTVAGYDIFRFDDAAQATCPVFIKFLYGTGGTPGSLNDVGLTPQVGQGTNGAGTLTGIAGLPFGYELEPITTLSAGAMRPVIASSDGSGFALAVNDAGLLFVCDRPRLADGTPTTEGVWCYWGWGTSGGMLVVPDTGTLPAPGTAFLAFDIGGEPRSDNVNTQVPLSPAFVIVNGKVRYSKMLLTYEKTTLTAGVPIRCSSWLGAERTILPLGGALAGMALVAGANSTNAPAIVWE
jgi:hypothetical protein